MLEQSGWCPSCGCGWYKAVDAFDVTPPESECRNPKHECHDGFWQAVNLEGADELEKRRLYGDR